MKKKSTIIALTLGTVLSIQAQNVGINTDGSDPDSDAILHIKNHSGSSLDPAVVRIENEKADNETGVQIKNSGATPNIQWNIYNPASGSTDLRISNNGTDRVTIQNDGDVGIGTTTPISRLDIQGSMGYKINTINTTTILDNTYNVVICNNGDYDVILPAAASNTGRVYYIKNNDSGGGVFTIDGNDSETINGSTTYDLDSYTHVVQIISDGTNWHIIEEANKNTGTITGLTCGSSTDYGTLQVAVATSGVSSDVPYTGGNNGVHSGQTVASTGVTGLTATLSPGSFNCGSGSLTYTIDGTPASSGTASFALDIGGQTCTLTRTVNTAIATLDCAGATDIGTLTDGELASGVSSVISYTGGNGAGHSGQTVASTGVTGLTATLLESPPGPSFASGAGTLTYNITGTPSGDGTASFAINIGGQTCTLERTVDASVSYPPGTVHCSGTPTEVVDVTFTYNSQTYTYMDRNLGASGPSTFSRSSYGSDAAYIAAQEFSFGDLYQWGRAADGHQCRNSSLYDGNSLTRPSSPTQSGSWDGKFIYGPFDWLSSQTDGAWSSTKTATDPCPIGYRVPTLAELTALDASFSSPNYNGAFNSPLKLPVAGCRYVTTGSPFRVGSFGYYWSSTVHGSWARHLDFSSSNAIMYSNHRAFGFSVRCIKD